MKRSEIEQQIRKELEGRTPDVLDRIKQAKVEVLSADAVPQVKVRNRKAQTLLRLASLAAVVVLMVFGVATSSVFESNKVGAVAMHVGEDIEFFVDEKMCVTNITSTSVKLSKILDEMNLKKRPLTEAVRLVWYTCVSMNTPTTDNIILSSPCLLLTVSSPNKNFEDELLRVMNDYRLTTSISVNMIEIQAKAQDEIVQCAQKNNVSVEQYRLMLRVQAKYKNKSLSELAKMDCEKLKKLLSYEAD